MSAARGGREAALHRARATKLQAQLAQHQFKADSAAQHAQQLETALRERRGTITLPVNTSQVGDPSLINVITDQAEAGLAGAGIWGG